MDLADIRVIERRYGPRFTIKPRSELGFRNLQRNVTVQLCVACLPHLTHSAFPMGETSWYRPSFSPRLSSTGAGEGFNQHM